MLKYTQFENKQAVGTEAGIILHTFIQDLWVQRNNTLLYEQSIITTRHSQTNLILGRN